MAETRTDIRAFGRLAAREIDPTELESVRGACQPGWETNSSTWAPSGDDKDDDCESATGGGDVGGTGDRTGVSP